MSSISPEEVAKIAKLARLKLSQDEIALYQRQMSRILDSMAKLRQLDTQAVPPTASVPWIEPSPREDEPAAFSNASALVALAPEREGPYFKVRKVIE
jgi:aspartyl-tRNA(Asn)/glutamyl-tRNA(Gln) amidotransferase subunit C